MAIGYDEVKTEEIAYANSQPKSQNALAVIIRDHYKEHKKPRYIGNQLLDFTYGIAKGDIVIIPSVNSDLLSFGEVEDERPYTGTKNSNVENPCPFLKRRKVNWLKKDVRLIMLDPQFYRIRFVHRALTKVDAYSEGFIDRELYPLFLKENQGHLAINVRTQEPIKFNDFYLAWSDLFKLTEEFGETENLVIDPDDFDIRVNVQSPGTVEFITTSVVAIVTMALVLSFVIGADFVFKSKLTGQIDIKTQGFLKRLSDFMEKNEDRKLRKDLRKRLEKMNIEPTEIVKLLNQANNKTDNDNS
ncbi:hypothetical protein GCM10028805_27290 [Spirosoma harenae]